MPQSCVLCAQQADFCICADCQTQFKKHTFRCKACARHLSGNLDFCGACLAHSPIFDRAWTLYDYEGVIAYLIKQFKYHKKLCIGAYFAHQLKQTYQQIAGKYDAIIPMPLNKKRIRVRGYNQVVELLTQFNKRNIIIDTHSCIRQKATQSLTSLTLEQRKKEIKGAFKVKSPLPYQRVLLIDDVMTTGSSLNELAKTILKSSPKVQGCDVLTLARGTTLT